MNTKKETFFIRILCVRVIVWYQKFLSFDHGLLRFLYPYGFCRYYPSCSEYSRQAILKYGVMRGGNFMAQRVLRCHPWSKGGIDPVK